MTVSAPSTIRQALGLATQALFLSNPNPRVGCVITSRTGEIVGKGSTQRAGGPHAEIMALRDAQARGHDLQGATAYVTLEPCSHHGRTGPCCDALIAAGIAKVVASLADPNPLVAGQGFARLRAAGVEVSVGDGAQESFELNIGFFSRMVRKTPWVRMKMAASLDGTTALPNGESQWITSSAARADGHAWRARACAVLTGIGTVLEDNPRLDVRDVATPRQPHVVVVDSLLQTPPDARLLIAGRACYIYCAAPNDTAFQARKQALESQGAVVVELPNAHNKVDLSTMLADLASRGVNELHVEAGTKLNGSFIREGLVDEMLVYLAPCMLGEGLAMAHFGPLTQLDQGLSLDFKSVEKIGPDVRILARVKGRDNFLAMPTAEL
ncbi:diaminohydroxyphosphoribosylaminopyrimidine deaminase/5-amino-6-(5-phosphoribosylamino)uracil reductase [Acidovorax temperans]|uniref:Riboflavin biosynthesis protein RibD n=1 Tax=Acidovorax temperans TaxID=80878 RepID=A0A543LKM9_9BURK|nr:bifunctional diaminohydroxyphosphoribosylaminopyrimidine deaminase/5-amino-6-(5-phosphoribosylamino)uracil reductase RibD [Acidovorax temperans]TQN07865.1 diaminohydroxyphosphoribosylaminopyrimidine deaminase/5-amino-6-(5-phosphoribosylamino)uracil reductase [Acidovorax temperans]WCT25298.1 bifunctional diaminohydroxyphosphoribosylaminopyrimidine deaminase/5-amino-6-(5-phosphoribosylamino)uracil reductase RibD [Acidovorax temperans]